jgi:hypothetical protein
VAPVLIGYPTSIPPASERHAPEIVKLITSAIKYSHIGDFVIYGIHGKD